MKTIRITHEAKHASGATLVINDVHTQLRKSIGNGMQVSFEVEMHDEEEVTGPYYTLRTDQVADVSRMLDRAGIRHDVIVADVVVLDLLAFLNRGGNVYGDLEGNRAFSLGLKDENDDEQTWSCQIRTSQLGQQLWLTSEHPAYDDFVRIAALRGISYVLEVQ